MTDEPRPHEPDGRDVAPKPEPPERSKLGIWFRAVRAFSFPASVVPVLVGAALAASHQGDVAWNLLPLVVVCSVLFHAATNVMNDYFDFRRGVDQDYTFGSSGVLLGGLLKPWELLAAGWVMFVVGSALGLILVWVRGLPMLVLGVVGFIGGYCYTGTPGGYKYVALGDVLVFVLMGPLMVIGSYFALTGVYAAAVLYVSIPVGCLVAAILASNNLRDIAHDAQASVKTLASVLGYRAAKWEYFLLVAGAYVSVVVMVLARVVTPWALVVFLSLPAAVANVRAVLQSREREHEEIATLDARTARLHLLFGLLFAGALVFERFVP